MTPVSAVSPSRWNSTGQAPSPAGSVTRTSARCATASGKRLPITGTIGRPSTSVSEPESAPSSIMKLVAEAALMMRSRTRWPLSTRTTSGSSSVRSLARNASYDTSLRSMPCPCRGICDMSWPD